MLPEAVLQRAQKELLNWQGTGISIMEIGHRTPIFQKLLTDLEEKLRQLMKIPPQYKILFLSGGGQGQFNLIPMNLTKYNQAVDYLVTGIWSERAAKYATKYASVNVVAQTNGHSIPDTATWQLNPQAAYVYYCPNETINGIQFHEIPNTGNVPLIADATSCILSEPIDINQFGLIFASAQKNLGIAGITLLIIRENLLEQAVDYVPEVFNYALQSEQHSLVNTIPTTAVYMMDLMVDWLIQEYGNLNQVAQIQRQKATLLYECIDQSNGFYSNPINVNCRSKINIPFNLPTATLLDKFLKNAELQNLKFLNGHKLVGGARASLYNAMPVSGVEQLCDFMHGFSKGN